MCLCVCVCLSVCPYLYVYIGEIGDPIPNPYWKVLHRLLQPLPASIFARARPPPGYVYRLSLLLLFPPVLETDVTVNKYRSNNKIDIASLPLIRLEPPNMGK